MDTGFETIGNATLIAYDRGPVLVTDPWIRGGAYFGSWGLSHEIPEEQFRAATSAPFVWFSHGHPDHLNGDSLELFRERAILLPDHVGGRIQRDLSQAGFKVATLPDRKWVQLSDRIRVLSICDESQNALLLVDVNGRLLVNLNDCIDRGWGRTVRRIIKSYDISILLSLTGYGDADMINFFDEEGERIDPPCARKFPVGRSVAAKTESFGCRYFVPFSSMHRYQRSDSIWASPYATPVEAHYVGFESKRCEMLPAFIRYDCTNDTCHSLAPRRCEAQPVDCKEFGDDWSEPLTSEDFALARDYFQAFEHLHDTLDFVNLRVGGADNRIEFKHSGFRRGITFEAPRHSLVESIRWKVFDDLLIGNFMRVTLHGRWPQSQLYPDFTPYVTKYGDNGHAYSRDELRHYFAQYAKRAPIEYLHHWLEEKCTNAVRAVAPHDSETYVRLKQLYWQVKAYV
jgi:L-ascorbate metabolism protein UlaG (beta-lactamase superfamily)